MFATDRTMPVPELAREAEARGFHSLYVPEHTHIPTSRRTPPPTGDEELAEEYKRVTDMFNDLKMKSKHFLMTDLKKFNDIWKMNEEECKALARNLLEADRIIFEHQLGLDYRLPDMY